MSNGDYCKQPVPPPPTASCYICLDGGSLLRNCACRGEAAGWAHVACLAKFAGSQVAEVANNGNPRSADLSVYWTNCNICKTRYMMNMGLAMAGACVKHYEHLEDTAYMRFNSLFFMASASSLVGGYDDAIRLYNCLVEICIADKKEGRDVREREAAILAGIGNIFVKQDRYHDAITALEREIEINIDLHGLNSPGVEERKIFLDMLNQEIRKERGQKVEDTATLLVSARKQFKEKREKYGDNGHAKMRCHFGLIHALIEDGKSQEAMKQYEQLTSESTHILGPDHPDTHLYKISAKKYRVKIQKKEELCIGSSSASKTTSQQVNVWAMIDCEKKPAMDGQRVKVLRATVKDATKYICLHKDHKGVCSKFKTVQKQLIFEEGTKVVLHGLVSSKDLNGTTGIILSFDKDKHRYAVEVGKKAGVLIKPINLNVVFA